VIVCRVMTEQIKMLFDMETGDPDDAMIAVALAIEPSAASWVLGFPYRERGEWGTRPDPALTEDGPYPVSISLDVGRFEELLAG